MLFSRKIPIVQKTKLKSRIFKKFKFYKLNKNFLKIKSLYNYRLFINNIKLIDVFLRKCVSKFRRGSRKEYYKKLNEKDNRIKNRMRPIKKSIKRFSSSKTFKDLVYLNFMKKIYLKKYRRIHNNYICFNTNKIPFSRKSNNSRMGKGKGKIKNWFLQIHSGKILFFLKRWNSDIALYALKILKMYLPSKNIAIFPSLKKKILYFSSESFLI